METKNPTPPTAPDDGSRRPYRVYDGRSGTNGSTNGNGAATGGARMSGGNGTPPAGPVRGAMRVYRAEPPRRRRRWLRVLLWTFGILLLLVAAAAGGVYLYLRDAVSTITSANTPELKKASNDLREVVPLPGAPATFLVLGYDARLGDATSRSDTSMLVRVDPGRRAMTMMSFPRDLQVQIPGFGTHSINEAYSYGGPSLALRTVHELTGLDINYLVPINFRGFKETVDAFDGVYIDVDRRYFNDRGGPSGYATINLQPGYQHLTGTRALDYARYRHGDSDIYRVARQQRFMTEFKRRVDHADIKRRIFDLVDIVKGNVRIIGPKGHAMGLERMIRYANLVQRLPRNRIYSVTIPTIDDPLNHNHVIVQSQTAIQDAVHDFANPQLGAIDAVARRDVPGGKKAKPAKPVYRQGSVLIDVRNGTGRPGDATNAAYALQRAGWKQACSVGEADTHEYLTTQVLYGTRPGSRAAAQDLAKIFPDADAKPYPAALRALAGKCTVRVEQADVAVIVGQSFDGQLLPKPEVKLIPPEKPKTRPAPSDDTTAWKAARRAFRGPLEMPTLLPSNLWLGDPDPDFRNPLYRVYTIDRKYRALYVTYHIPGIVPQAMGFQAVKWRNPPILDNPTRTAVVKGRTYKVYFNGQHVQRIAWSSRGVTYWITNTLANRVPNATMWAMAASFRPVPT